MQVHHMFMNPTVNDSGVEVYSICRLWSSNRALVDNSDKSKGILEDIIGKIFDPFFFDQGS